MPIPEAWLPIIRNFEDRGMQVLLQAPENARGLLCILAADLCERLDFPRMVCEPVSFTARDLRRRETDLVLRVPCRDPGEEGREVWIYLLIEHQSTPDLEMRVRLLYGMAGLWDRQRREFDSRDVPVAARRYLAILPVVLYTGEDRWEITAPVTSLMDVPAGLEEFQPRFRVLPLDVKQMKPDELVASDHPFAWLLRVIQEEHSPLEQLRPVVMEAMRRVDSLVDVDRTAFEAALVFLILLLYQRRGRGEGDQLTAQMAQAHPTRLGEDVVRTVKSAFQEAVEEGEARGQVRVRQELLLMQFREKFGEVPEPAAKRVQALGDTEALDVLARRLMHVERLEEMGL